MPDYFNKHLHVPYQKSSWLTAGPLFFGGISCLVGVRQSGAVCADGPHVPVPGAIFPISGAFTACVAMLLLMHARTPLQATILLCLAAAAFDFGQAANWATIVDLGGRYAGTTAGSSTWWATSATRSSRTSVP